MESGLFERKGAKKKIATYEIRTLDLDVMINPKLPDWGKGLATSNVVQQNSLLIRKESSLGYGRANTGGLRILSRKLATLLAIAAIHIKQRIAPLYNLELHLGPLHSDIMQCRGIHLMSNQLQSPLQRVSLDYLA